MFIVDDLFEVVNRTENRSRLILVGRFDDVDLPLPKATAILQRPDGGSYEVVVEAAELRSRCVSEHRSMMVTLEGSLRKAEIPRGTTLRFGERSSVMSS